MQICNLNLCHVIIYTVPMYAKTLKGFSHAILVEGRSFDNEPDHVIKKVSIYSTMI